MLEALKRLFGMKTTPAPTPVPKVETPPAAKAEVIRTPFGDWVKKPAGTSDPVAPAPEPEPAKPVEQPKVEAPKNPVYGKTVGNYYEGNARYEPVEPMDEAKYQEYLSRIVNKRNPKTTRFWTMWEIAPELGVTLQQALDMIARAQTEHCNAYLPGTVAHK